MDFIAGGFRWVKPAASLKLDLLREALPAESRRFRWVKPAASLKRLIYTILIQYIERFRWVKPAASLKPAKRPLPSLP